MDDKGIALTDKDTIIAIKSLNFDPIDIQVVTPDDPQKKPYMVWYFPVEAEPIAEDWNRFVNGLPLKEKRPKFKLIQATIDATKSFQNCWYSLVRNPTNRKP